MIGINYIKLKETWKKGIKLTDLKEGDIIYIRKIINNFTRTYECKFIKFEKGLIHAQIIIYSPEWWTPVKEFITARQKTCYLWGKDPTNLNMRWAYCHWLEDGEFI